MIQLISPLHILLQIQPIWRILLWLLPALLLIMLLQALIIAFVMPRSLFRNALYRGPGQPRPTNADTPESTYIRDLEQLRQDEPELYRQDGTDTLLAQLKAGTVRHLWLRSFDGLHLHGWLLPASSTHPVDLRLLIIPGYRDPVGKILRYLIEIRKTYNCELILTDPRAQGFSEGIMASLGPLESRDVEAWIRYVQSPDPTNAPVDKTPAMRESQAPLILLAWSLGASATLAALPTLCEEPQSPRPDALILDSPFTDLPRLLEHLYPGGKFKRLIRSALFRHAQRELKLDLRQFDLRPKLDKINIPVFLTHGTRDRVVPFYMGEEIGRSLPRLIDFYVGEDCGHCKAIFKQPEQLMERLGRFLSKVTNGEYL